MSAYHKCMLRPRLYQLAACQEMRHLKGFFLLLCTLNPLPSVSCRAMPTSFHISSLNPLLHWWIIHLLGSASRRAWRIRWHSRQGYFAEVTNSPSGNVYCYFIAYTEVQLPGVRAQWWILIPLPLGIPAHQEIWGVEEGLGGGRCVTCTVAALPFSSYVTWMWWLFPLMGMPGCRVECQSHRVRKWQGVEELAGSSAAPITHSGQCCSEGPLGSRPTPCPCGSSCLYILRCFHRKAYPVASCCPSLHCPDPSIFNSDLVENIPCWCQGRKTVFLYPLRFSEWSLWIKLLKDRWTEGAGKQCSFIHARREHWGKAG